MIYAPRLHVRILNSNFIPLYIPQTFGDHSPITLHKMYLLYVVKFCGKLSTLSKADGCLVL